MSLSFIEAIGFAASAFVFLTFYMRTLLPLRLVALVSNVLFIAYGMMAGLLPILALHLMLLPMNGWRAYQHIAARRHLRRILESDPDIGFLLPVMTRQRCSDGETVFRIGDTADRLYVVLEGAVRVVEFNKTIAEGGLFGEVALFVQDARRTASVVSEGEATLAWIDRERILKVFRDNPDFALALTKLITTRLSDNQASLRQQLNGATGT